MEGTRALDLARCDTLSPPLACLKREEARQQKHETPHSHLGRVKNSSWSSICTFGIHQPYIGKTHPEVVALAMCSMPSGRASTPTFRTRRSSGMPKAST